MKLTQVFRGEKVLFFYDESGSISIIHTFLMLLLGIFISLVAAYLLHLGSSISYLPFLLPALFFVLIYFALYITINFGRCRNLLAGFLLGALIGVVYYGGFWYINYHIETNSWKPMHKTMIERTYDLELNFVGYLRFRARQLSESQTDGTFGMSIMVSEFIFFSVIAGMLATILSSRIFFEKENRWARRKKYYYANNQAEKLIEALVQYDWETLLFIPRKRRAYPWSPHIQVQFHYISKSEGSPVFVTVKAIYLSRDFSSPHVDRGSLKGLSETLLDGFMVPASQVKKLAAVFEDIDLPRSSSNSSQYQRYGSKAR